MNRKDWVVNGSVEILHTRIWDVLETSKTTPDGKDIKTVSLKAPNWCSAVIKNIDTGKFIMNCEYRHGVNKWVFEFPSGTVEEGETPDHAVIREVIEETGYKNPVIVKQLFVGNPNPAFMNNSMTCYYIEVSGKPDSQNLDPDETITIKDVDNPLDYFTEETSVMNQLAWCKYVQQLND